MMATHKILLRNSKQILGLDNGCGLNLIWGGVDQILFGSPAKNDDRIPDLTFFFGRAHPEYFFPVIIFQTSRFFK
jgi:hypothetical protein